ncbi:spore cortex biosynthesis protein YabQ [Fontibacillus phaseoli]|uniref:Spore cortex biosynthesis protein YabQ n=1 Tax=Fontibacillus phaseoli TaxID=1416533 RepID=A0A369B0H3_9BACL|nr:spore cortex biosynthesis protein YabQ [Fontibacillus phaseoli]RCX14913.1 spore cortex biosynthesis protein YabQ [Fontibacillus phaseoli]
MNLQLQWVTLLWMFACGGILGIAFDSYRVVSGQLRFPRWSVHILDLLYWIAASLFVFRTLYRVNQGELRFYVFLGLFIGVWIHFLFLSVITERFVVNLIKVVQKIYRIAIRIMQLAVLAPLKWLLKSIRMLLGFVWIVVFFMGRVTLSPIWKLLIWATRPIWKSLRLPDRLRSVRNYFARLWKAWFSKE